MGCFPVLKCRKKKPQTLVSRSANYTEEKIACTLPEPDPHERSLQSAPPSFRNITGSTHAGGRLSSSRVRALSAPSSLVVDDQVVVATEFEDQEEFQSKGLFMTNFYDSNPLPLPLPSPEDTSVLKNWGSFKSSNLSGPLTTSGPLPLPPLDVGGLRNFSYVEISAACQYFSADQCMSDGISSTFYKATFGDDIMGLKKSEATVARLRYPSKSLKEFVNEATMLASLQHPQLCKLIGFHAQEGSDVQMLIYEKLHHGSLDHLLYGRSDGAGAAIDWYARMKVALCAAKGLAFLHDEGPFQAMYHEFSTSNIQVDKDFTAKLSGYGCVSSNLGTDISSSSIVTGNLSVETLEKGILTPKSNVWSFGTVLLELLTGRKNHDSQYPKEERNIVKWSKPFLADDCRLSLIMDPRIKGRCSAKAARAVADIAVKCLQKDPSERPTMRSIVESLKNVQDMKYSSRYPLQEPNVVAGKQMLKSPSLNGIIPPPTISKFSPSPPSRAQPLLSPRNSTSIPLPPFTCSTTSSIEDTMISSIRKSPLPSLQRPGVEGF